MFMKNINKHSDSSKSEKWNRKRQTKSKYWNSSL